MRIYENLQRSESSEQERRVRIMPKLYNWYIVNKGKYCIAHGNVMGSDKFPDSLDIHTSKIANVNIRNETVQICTKNTIYVCDFRDCCFEKQKQLDCLPVDLAVLARKYKKEYQATKNSVLLVFSDHAKYYFEKAEVCLDAKVMDLPMHVHIGMFQDSCLIGDIVEGGQYDIRYFPHPGNVEFYTVEVENLPVDLLNAGEKILYFRTEYGIIAVDPKEKKRLKAKNVLDKNIVVNLKDGDLYPA